MNFLVADSQNGSGVGTKIPSDAITEPGCYVCLWSGHLLRIASNNYPVGCAPVISIVGGERMFVTKISDNPYITLSEAEMLSTRLAHRRLVTPGTSRKKESSSGSGTGGKSPRTIRKVAGRKGAAMKAGRGKTTRKSAARPAKKSSRGTAKSKRKAAKKKGRR